MLCHQVISLGDLGFPRLAAVKRPAFLQQIRAGSTVDRAVHTATAQKGRVGGIDDGIHFGSGDIPFDDFNTIGHLLCLLSFCLMFYWKPARSTGRERFICR